MLKNDPPPGTLVRFVKEVRKVSTKNIATLKESIDAPKPEVASDRFLVEVDGEVITVRREDIEEI